MDKIAKPSQGMSTCNVSRFTKLWYEVSIAQTNLINSENHNHWIRYNKGGSFRKWYGNREYVVNWKNNGNELLSAGALLRNKNYYFRSFIAWTKISGDGTGFRMFEDNFLFDGAGGTLMLEKAKPTSQYLLALLNSKPIAKILDIISPTINYNEAHIGSIPVLLSDNLLIEKLSANCVDISKSDWDSFETSWDFEEHPLLKNKVDTIKKAYTLWKSECNERFKQLKENEEELNRIFIDIYGLQDELTPEESDKDVTVHYVVDRKEDIPESFKGSNYVRTKQDEIKSFISYAVGCMFGRYSLDIKGLAYAGGEWDSSKYSTFIPDKDNIIPIYEDEFYGDDDITGRFIEFVKVVFGEDDLEANLKFIADSLGGRGTPRKVIRAYFINDFFKDHCQMYQVTGSGKRPIYWQFDSGKKNGFKALVYIHRYKPDLIARMRTEYVHPQQARYRTQINMLENQIGSVSKSDEIRIKKEIQTIKAKADELAIYEEKIHHWADKMEPMDLDDGVVNNYNKFQELLVPNVVKKPKEK